MLETGQLSSSQHTLATMMTFYICFFQRRFTLNVKDQLDPLKTCAHVIEPQDQRPLMTLSPHPQWDVFFLTLILSGMTLFLFIISIFSKLYWGAGDIDAWNVLPVKSSELSEPAEVSSCAVYGISTFEHEECQSKKTLTHRNSVRYVNSSMFWNWARKTLKSLGYPSSN